MKPPPIPPLRHTGNSANIAFYGPVPEAAAPLYLYAEVLRTDTDWRAPRRGDGTRPPLRRPRFSIVLKWWPTGGAKRMSEIEFTYTPKTKPRPGPLPAVTVTRLIRQHIAGPG